MSEYVEIRSSPAEIISIATGMGERGRALVEKAGNLGRAIATQEGNDRAYPSDQFSDQFLVTYHQAATDAAGNASTANVAVRDSAVQAGATLGKIGDFVGKAMTNYGAVDEESGADISKTEL